ncbi:MAG TPA: hypothetical protein PKC76_13380 [Saprospiraceae bacterium]|nr:hypothetical protein [Saprospiraceae bacterium]HMP25125.1 hypothetical protein [Saprospiraceae bacterium]
MKQVNSIKQQIENLKDAISKKEIIPQDFQISFKRETIESTTLGINKEVSIVPENIGNAPPQAKSKQNDDTAMHLPKVQCNGTNIIFVSGNGVTDSSGNSILYINEIACSLPIDEVDQINFVATPMGSLPSILTFLIDRQNGTITVYSFDLEGKPKKNVPFHWHIMANYFLNIVD